MRHKLDIAPIPEKVLYINEPWMIDGSIDSFEFSGRNASADSTAAVDHIASIDHNPSADHNQPDNVRIYLPMDLNKAAILRRLDAVVNRYGEANEMNEMNFSADVSLFVYQIEAYDQVWYARHGDVDGKRGLGSRHSAEAVSLVKEFIAKLEAIPDGCAECFPFELIDELKHEYLG